MSDLEKNTDQANELDLPRGVQMGQPPRRTSPQDLFPNFPSKEDWATLELITKTFISAGATPKGIDTAPKMMVVLQAGREAGLTPIESLNSLYFVNGKVQMYGESVQLQVFRAGHKISWGKCDAETATVTITRGDNGESMSQTFTMKEARERGYTSNPIYAKYPENMLKWRSLGMVVKFLCPEALKGIGIKEISDAETFDEKSPFSNKENAQNVEQKIHDGTYTQRPLDEVLNSYNVSDVDTVEYDDVETEKTTKKSAKPKK